MKHIRQQSNIPLNHLECRACSQVVLATVNNDKIATRPRPGCKRLTELHALFYAPCKMLCPQIHILSLECAVLPPMIDMGKEADMVKSCGTYSPSPVLASHQATECRMYRPWIANVLEPGALMHTDPMG